MPDTPAERKPVYLADLLDTDQLEEEILGEYVTRKQHPELPISILTYTDKAVYDRRWNDVTSKCRGLVVDSYTGQVYAHVFPKFHHAWMHTSDEHTFASPLPDEPFDVYEKVDGSLAVIFHLGDRWHVATKASFISDQAVWAQRWLDERDTSALIPGNTYLAEIVYPGNRIVVDYGDTRELVLLAVYDPAGIEQPIEDYDFVWKRLGGRPATRYRPGPTIEQLMKAADEDCNPFGCEEISGTGDEGYVVRFRPSGTRAKIKYADYLRLHRKLTGITARDIWRAVAVREIGDTAVYHATAFCLKMPKGEVRMMLAKGDPFVEMLDNVPDEFQDWVRGIESDLLGRAATAYALIGAAYLRIAHLAHDRHAFTKAAQATPYAKELFRTLDGQSVGPLIWGRLRPPKSPPFRTDDEG